MRWIIAFTTVAVITISVNMYLIGKVEARSQFGEAYALVMEYGDFVTRLELQQYNLNNEGELQ